jgi:hypothetical protein
LGTLPAVLIALGLVVIMLPLVILVADGQRWAVTVADAVSLVVLLVSGFLGGFLLLALLGYLVHAFGVDLPGFSYEGRTRFAGVLVFLIALAVVAPAFVASNVARARLGSIKGR